MMRNFGKHNGSADNFLSLRLSVTIVGAVDES